MEFRVCAAIFVVRARLGQFAALLPEQPEPDQAYPLSCNRRQIPA
ncbi:hypothetical protein OG271_18125 [Micromonospora rifamycinica]|nr:hypothetical protein [Micromonospora rifamycinica]